MSTFSDKFDNHWKCIPYAMATLTSSDNLISCSQNKGALCTFYVNWSEIRAIHKVSSQISDKGWVYLRGLCLNSEVRPISAIPLTILNDVVRQYPHTSLNINTPSLNMNEGALNMSRGVFILNEGPLILNNRIRYI